MTRRREAGFSLVELTITMSILGIMMVVITSAFTVMARTTNQTHERLHQSRGAKFAGIYWNPDVASSELVNPAGVRCGTTGSALVTFRWVDDRVAQPQVSTWATVTSGASTSLERYQCASNALSAPARTNMIAPNIAATGTAVSCDAGAGLTACGPDSTPRRVQLTIETTDGRTLTVDGTREMA